MIYFLSQYGKVVTIHLAKENKREIAGDLNSTENHNQIFLIARQMIKEWQDITGFSCLKDASGNIVVDKNGTKDMSK